MLLPITASRLPILMPCVYCQCRRLAFQDASVPRITVPQRMVERIQSAMKKRDLKMASKKRGVLRFKSPLLVSCRRTAYNHHKGQTYSEFSPKILASHGWKHRKSAGDHFTLQCHDRNPALLEADTQESFSNFGFHEDIVQGLTLMGIQSPTNIQRLAIPSIMTGSNVLVAAETGSGKTLTYLLPMVELIQRQRSQTQSEGVDFAPKVIIIAPGRELVDQITSVAEKLSEHLPFVPCKLCGGSRNSLKRNVDMLISTPGVLGTFLRRRWVNPSRLQTLALDESDTLLDDSFSPLLVHVMRLLGVKCGDSSRNDTYLSTGTQVLLVSATMPRNLEEAIGDTIPIGSLEKVTTDHLHHLMPHVPQKFLRVLPSHKPETILKQISKSSKRGLPTLIFCNRNTTSIWLHRFLKENKVENLLMNSYFDEVRFEQFERFQNGDMNILVCTDIASRGLDTLRAQQVINYEFPQFMSDYIHRTGRVGRVGSLGSGSVFSFITYPWEVDLLWHIETSARKMTELHNVNANIKRKLTYINEAKFDAKKS